MSPSVHKPGWALLLAIAACALGACSEERSTSFGYPDPRCLPFPWASLALGTPGEVPPDLACASTLGCPPPLTCRLPRNGGTGACSLLEDVPDPSAPAQVYGVPEFLLSATEGDDYNLLEFSGLPPSATVMHCSFHICPPDADVLRDAPGRCLFDSKTINLGLTNGLALSVVVNGPDDVAVGATIPACAPDDGADRPYKITAVGYYAICYAFDETTLVAVSAISNLTREEVGSAGQDAYHADCAGPEATDGVGCSYVSAKGEETLGACVAGACCGSCWSDKDCERIGGTTCRLIRDVSPDSINEVGGGAPLVGFCRDAVCGTKTGQEQCVTQASEAGADGGVADGGVADGGADFVSFWQANYPPEGFDCDGNSTAEGGTDAPSEPDPAPDMALARDMSPSDAGPGPAADMGPPPDGGAPADMGPPPDMDPPVDAEVPDRRPRMP